jgi:hypothetical protein
LDDDPFAGDDEPWSDDDRLSEPVPIAAPPFDLIGFARALIAAVAIGLLIWALIAFAIYMLIAH